MVYIPTDWLQNKDNFNKVYDILNKLDNDLKDNDSYTEENAIKQLEELKETTIIEKLKDGVFNFGA